MLTPGIYNARDFSEIPLNCAIPSPVIFALVKFIPGLIPASKPLIVDFGAKVSDAIIATGAPRTSTNTTSYV